MKGYKYKILTKDKQVPKFRIKKGDRVSVIVGKDKGSSGKVLSVDPLRGRATVEGINIVKRHRREGKSGSGGITDMPAPIAMSNLKVKCPSCSKVMRPMKKTVTKLKDGRTKHFHVRACRLCKEQLDSL